jgi:hypothetical protein
MSSILIFLHKLLRVANDGGSSTESKPTRQSIIESSNPQARKALCRYYEGRIPQEHGPLSACLLVVMAEALGWEDANTACSKFWLYRNSF